MKSDHDYLALSLTRFLGVEAGDMDPGSLAADFARFRFLLGATDGEGVFTSDGNGLADHGSWRRFLTLVAPGSAFCHRCDHDR